MDHFWYFVLLAPSVVFVFGFPGAPKDFSRESHQMSVNSFNTPTSCLVKEFNFTATVTDRNGKKCRGKVTTKACFGSCESSEMGTFQFPWILRVQPVCNYGQVVTRIVRLRHCEPGADRDAAFYRFPEAKSCICERCDPKRQHCEPATTRQPIIPDQTTPKDIPKKDSASGSFSDYSNDSPDTSILLPHFIPRRKWD